MWPLMQDNGRCFTSYVSNCIMNEKLFNELEATSDADYRRKLQLGGIDILRSQQNREQSRDDYYCNVCAFNEK